MTTPSDLAYRQIPLSVAKKKTGPTPRPVAERFWEKVNKTESCWLWQAATMKNGYGVFGLGRECKMALAHRVSWALAYGDTPKNLQVLHKCDTPHCVNPDHLFVGTISDNMKDCSRKRRCKHVIVGRLTGGITVYGDQA